MKYFHEILFLFVCIFIVVPNKNSKIKTKNLNDDFEFRNMIENEKY